LREFYALFQGKKQRESPKLNKGELTPLRKRKEKFLRKSIKIIKEVTKFAATKGILGKITCKY
jgi:hypothetical protein